MVTLSLDALGYAYPAGPRAVDGVALELGRGELACVIGPNGAGKSTLVKLIAGLVAPDAGRVSIDGRPLASLAPRERARQIAVVPQSLRALPDVTVLDFVLGGRYPHLGAWRRTRAGDRAAARRALGDADAADLEPRLLTELSGGQRQRVMIARALAQEAEVLLVDEPTTSLDPEHQLAVFALLARLTCEGRTALAVTHELNLASQFATTILLMQAGRIVARGAAGDVLRAEVLGPVYGTHLRYGRWPGPAGRGERPFVVPWLG
jgi:ABC-type cobalamin/Fe3+-siderophores transport system ATPase subunit